MAIHCPDASHLIVQCCDQHERLVEQLVDAGPVGLDAHHAIVRERGGRIRQQPAAHGSRHVSHGMGMYMCPVTIPASTCCHSPDFDVAHQS